MKRVVFSLMGVLLPIFIFGQVVSGYKIKRDYDGDTIVGYLSENVGTGNTGVVFVNAGDTNKIYSDGSYLVLDPATGVKIKDLTYRNGTQIVSIHNERLYVTPIDSLAPQTDTVFVNYCDGCTQADGWIYSGDTINIDTSGGGATTYWELNGMNITPVDGRSILVSDSLLFNASRYLMLKTDILSDVLDNNSFETNSGYIDPPPGFILFDFTGWSGGANLDSSHTAHTGSLSADITTGNIYQAKSLTSGTQYAISFWHQGAGNIGLCRGTTCYNFSTGAWVTSTTAEITHYDIPASTEWENILLYVTPNSTASHTVSFRSSGEMLLDDVYLGIGDEYLEIGSDDIRIATLPVGTSDTSVVVENGKIYKRVIPSGSIDTFYVEYSVVKSAGWKQSGDTIFIDTTQTAINYDTLAAYLNLDSLVTSALIDSIVAVINIDSLVTVNVTNYLDTNTRLVDTFFVSYSTGQTLTSGWRYSGDTIYIDTSIYNDTVVFSYIQVDSITVTTVHVDTIVLGTDTVYSITQLQDSLYFNFTSAPSTSAWVGMGDTVSIDTAAMHIWALGDAGIQNAKFKNSQNYVTGNYGIAIGYQDTMTGSYAFASGWKTISSGQGSTATGVRTKASSTGSYAGGLGQTIPSNYVIASGVGSFNHSTTSGTTSDASGQASAILGGVSNNVSGANSVALGGSGQNITKDNTVGVPDLYATDSILVGSNTEFVTSSGSSLVVGGATSVTVNSPVILPTTTGVTDIGSTAKKFSSLHLSDTAYTGGLRVDIASAAAGRVAASQDADGTIEFVPVSELTGTQDTFYLGYGTLTEGWLLSGDSILIDTTKPKTYWSRSGHGLYPTDTLDSISIGTVNKYASLYIEGQNFGLDDTLIQWGYRDDYGINYTGSLSLEENINTLDLGLSANIKADVGMQFVLTSYPESLGFTGDGFGPGGDSSVQLGAIGARFTDSYFAGTVYSGNLDLNNLSSGTGNILVLDGTTVKTSTATLDTSLWALSGTNLYPKSTSYNVAIGKATASYDLDVAGSARTVGTHYFNNANNYIKYDGSFGLDISGYPATIDFYVSGAKFAEMNNSTPAFYPYLNNDADLGLTGQRWKNQYIAGTHYVGASTTLANGMLSTSAGYMTVNGYSGVTIQSNTGEIYLDPNFAGGQKVRFGGDLYGSINNTYDVGAATYKFKDGYFDGTLNTDILTVDESATIADSLSIGTTTKYQQLYIEGKNLGGYDTLMQWGYRGTAFPTWYGSLIQTDNVTELNSSGQLYLSGKNAIFLWDQQGNNTVSLNSGAFRPQPTNTLDLGGVSEQWKHGYFTGTLYSGKSQIGTSPDYTTIDTNGLILHGNHTVWDDLRVNPTSEGIPANRVPGWTAYKSSYVQAFDDAGTEALEDEVFFRVQIPHTWKEGSTIYPHVHWTTPTAAASDSVSWEFYYSWANEGAAFPDADSLMVTTLVGASADIHHASHFAGISGVGKTGSSMLVCGLKRHSTEAGDTYSDEVYLLEFDIHFEVDKLGSIKPEEY